MSRKIRQGDEVIVLSGRDKKKRGQVLRVWPKGGAKVIVQGVNLVKRHRKGNPQLQIEAGIFEHEIWLPACKVAIYNPVAGKADRVGFRVEAETGKKIRYFKSTGEPIDRE